MDDFEEVNGDTYKGDAEVNYYYDELMELYDVSQKMEEDMRELWENTIDRYMQYCHERQILIMMPDYSKFYEYMVKHNIMYKYVLDRIHELENE